MLRSSLLYLEDPAHRTRARAWLTFSAYMRNFGGCVGAFTYSYTVSKKRPCLRGSDTEAADTEESLLSAAPENPLQQTGQSETIQMFREPHVDVDVTT